MEEILKYKNRDKLYGFLIKDFGLTKVYEEYAPESFGNFLVIIESNDFLLTYINDRSIISIDISSKLEPDNSFALSHVKDFMYNPDNINSDKQGTDNAKQIEDLNKFLKRDFQKISDLFNSHNYPETKTKINDLLEQQFKRKFPGMIE